MSNDLDADYQLAMRLQAEEFQHEQNELSSINNQAAGAASSSASAYNNIPVQHSYQHGYHPMEPTTRSHQFMRLADEYDASLQRQQPWRYEAAPANANNNNNNGAAGSGVSTILAGINRMRTRNTYNAGNGGDEDDAPNAQGRIAENVAQEFDNLASTNTMIVAVYCFLGLAELLAAAIILALQWNKTCDRPLQLWTILYCSRWLILLPLSIHKLYTHHRSIFEYRIKTYVDLFAVILWSIGQLWLFNSETCQSEAPVLYGFDIALIAIQYIRILLPLILILLLICCLPVVMISVRLLAPHRGADKKTIEKLPVRSATAEDTENECSVCLNNYALHDQIRILPCAHEFHTECVDEWLIRNKTCCLCRAPIDESPATSSNSSSAGQHPAQRSPSNEPILEAV
jgi:hypothetical protein